MKQNNFDGFGVDLFQDDEGDWIAHFAEMPHISAFGPNPIKALSSLKEAWEEVKESYQASGEELPVAPLKKEYSGQFSVRIDKRVHRALAAEAARVGLSLNALVAQKLATSVT